MLLPPNTSPQHPRGQTEGCCFPRDTSACSGMLSSLGCRGSSAPAPGAPLPAPPAPPALPPPPPGPHLSPTSACPSSCPSSPSSSCSSSRPTSCSSSAQLVNWTLAGPFLTLLLPLSPLLDSSRCPLSSPPLWVHAPRHRNLARWAQLCPVAVPPEPDQIAGICLGAALPSPQRPPSTSTDGTWAPTPPTRL